VPYASGVTTSLSDDLRFAVDLARSAGEIVRHHYGHVERLTKTHAATTDEAVTEADRAAQRHIVAGLRGQFPGDGIIGEESDTGTSITFDVKDPDGRNWVIDPIDGTNNFIAGLGAFAVCIGRLDAGRPVLGVVYDVTRGVTYAAAAGLGATVDGRPTRAPATPLGDASVLMMTSNLLGKDGRAPAWACRWIGQTAWKTRILGSAAIEAVQVAAGVAHGAVTVNGKLWDVVAPAAIVLEAGGTLTDLSGREIFPFDLRGYVGAKVPFLAAGPAARSQLLAELASTVP
jgi:fructose-1,6-bisphosphatase/inositol monophosphatase family enzyme